MYSAFKEFYNLLSQVNSVYHDAALKLGLTDSELDILYSINEHGSGCNQSIFYKETGTTKSTINSAVRKMEQFLPEPGGTPAFFSRKKERNS